MVTDNSDQVGMLFSELRQANEKYLDVRIENNKLKDQINSQKITIEKLKIDATAVNRNRVVSSPVQRNGGVLRKKTPATSQDLGRVDVELRARHEGLKTQTQQVCSTVQNFMTAMRAL